MMFDNGTRHLEDLEYLPCSCPVCSSTTPSELLSLVDKERTRQLSLHNLYVCYAMIDRIKQAMVEGSLWELVERTCTSHPKLLQALGVIRENAQYLERFEPLSKKRFFYTGEHSLARPDVRRYRDRFFARYHHYRPQFMILFEDELEAKKPYSRTMMDRMGTISKDHECLFMLKTPFGPVPMELDTMYPIGQSILPEFRDLPGIEQRRIISLMEKYSHLTQDFMGLVWDGEQTLEAMDMMENRKNVPYRYDLLKVVAVCDYQFGRDAAKAVLGTYDLDELETRGELRKSKNTGMIRNVIVDGEHVFSLRASDGFFTLKLPGARRLMQAFPSPKLRVVVNGDSFPFNKEGKNVFAPFVVDADEDVRPGDDVIIVNDKDELAGVGRALMNREEMLAFKSGIAVRTKSGDKDEEENEEQVS